MDSVMHKLSVLKGISVFQLIAALIQIASFLVSLFTNVGKGETAYSYASSWLSTILLLAVGVLGIITVRNCQRNKFSVRNFRIIFILNIILAISAFVRALMFLFLAIYIGVTGHTISEDPSVERPQSHAMVITAYSVNAAGALIFGGLAAWAAIIARRNIAVLRSYPDMDVNLEYTRPVKQNL